MCPLPFRGGAHLLAYRHLVARFEEALAEAEKVGDEPTQVAALIALGDRQLDEGKANEAFATFKRAGALATRLEIEDLEWRSWFRIGAASRARGKSGLAPISTPIVQRCDSSAPGTML